MLQKIILSVGALLLTQSLCAQWNMSIMGGAGLPHKQLKTQNYPGSGSGVGMSIACNTSKLSYVGVEFGWQTYYSYLGAKTYTFGNEKDQLFHQSWTNNATSKLTLKLGRVNPFVGYSAGLLSSSVKESLSNDCADCGTVTNTLRNVVTYNQNFSGGLSIKLAPGIAIDLSSNYTLGGKTKFIDYNKVVQTTDYLYFDYQESKVFDYLMFNVGLKIIFNEMEDSTNSNSSDSSTNESNSSQDNTSTTKEKKEEEKCTPDKKPKSRIRTKTPANTPTREPVNK